MNDCGEKNRLSDALIPMKVNVRRVLFFLKRNKKKNKSKTNLLKPLALKLGEF